MAKKQKAEAVNKTVKKPRIKKTAKSSKNEASEVSKEIVEVYNSVNQKKVDKKSVDEFDWDAVSDKDSYTNEDREKLENQYIST